MFGVILRRFFQQGCIKLTESNSKDIYNVTNVSNKCCSLELSVHLRILKNKIYHHLHKKYCAAQLYILIENTYFKVLLNAALVMKRHVFFQKHEPRRLMASVLRLFVCLHLLDVILSRRLSGP